MSEGWAAWELPASAHLRSVSEILLAPPSPEERRALRREQAEAEAKRASAADTADNAAAAAFMGRVTATPPRDVLAEAAAGEPFRDREAAARRRAAIDVLRPLGLADVITGGQSRCRLRRQYGHPRAGAGCGAAGRARPQYVAGGQPGWPRRAGRSSTGHGRSCRSGAGPWGWTGGHRAPRPDDAARRQYERACREIGAEPVSYR